MHELGHLLFLYLFKRKINFLTLYPFGAVIDYELKNDFNYKELLISFGGVLMNGLGVIIFTFNDSLRIMSFLFIMLNLLPIYPLDGAKLLESILNHFFPVRINKKVINILSIILLITFFIIAVIFHKGVYFLFLILTSIRINFIEMKNIKCRYQAFKIKKYLYPNSKLKRKMVRLYCYNPLAYLFYGYNLDFNFDSFCLSEEELLKKEYKL